MEQEFIKRIEEINAKYKEFGFDIVSALDQKDLDNFITKFKSEFGILPDNQITDFLKITNGIDSPAGWAALGFHPNEPTFDIFSVTETNRIYNGVSSNLICVATGDAGFIGYNTRNKNYEALNFDRLEPYNQFENYNEVLKHVLGL